MALTLDATLLAAQSAASRHPICSVVARRAVDDIPLPRNPGFAPDTYGQVQPAPVTLSSGALAVFYAGNNLYGDYHHLRVIYTDTDRTTFNPYIGVYGTDISYGIIQAIAAVEMNSSGTVGVVMYAGPSGYYEYVRNIRALIVTSAGVTTSNIEVLNNTDLRGMSVVKTAAGGYLLYYAYKSGTDYYLAVRSSADFITWSSATVLSVSGLTATSEVKDIRVTRLADDSYMMVFSYQDYIDSTGSIYNIYHSNSTDGTTWTAAAQVTDTALKSRDYTQPDFVQMASGDVFVSAMEANTYLAIGNSSSGWINNSNGSNVIVRDNWIDSTAGYYYFITHTYGNMSAMVRVDIASWTIDKIFHGQNTPTFPARYISRVTNSNGHKGAGNLAPLCLSDQGVLLMDFDTDTVRVFNFYDFSGTHGPDHAQNVTWDSSFTGYYGYAISGAWVDIANNRLYVSLPNDYYHDRHYLFGYIDLAQTGPTYAFTELIRADVEAGNASWHLDFAVYPGDDLMLLWGSNSFYGGRLIVWDLSSGGMYKWYRVADYADFPAAGVNGAVLVGDKIYATACHTPSSYPEEYKYWLLEIDLNTDQIVYYYPTFTADKRFNNDTNTANYYFGRIYHNVAATELIIDGMENPVVFNYTTHVWEYVDYNADEGPPTESERWYSLVYDPTTDNYFGSKNANTAQTYLMPRSGSANRTTYQTGEYTTSWGFTDPQLLISGFKNVQAQLTRTSDDAVWAFWRDETVSTANLSWGKTGAQVELSEYLTGETEATWRLDGSPNELSFSCSHGHLFDPGNKSSILNYYLRKGNLAVLRFGDKVSGVEYWSNQGKFVIRETSLKYQRGQYPVISVRCEDVRTLWDQHEVRTTQVTASYPEEAIKAIVKAHTPFTDDDFSLPTFTGRFTFDASWIDTPLLDILNDIANRWNYFLMMDADGKLTARLINTAAAVSNAYPDKTKLIDYTPDDSYSDLVNQIAVTGQGKDDIEVLYTEERVGELSGTIGWWGCSKDIKVWFSDDKSRRVKFARLNVIESTTGIMFHLAGKTSERISYRDPEHKYCIVEIKVPNLTGLLIYAIFQYLYSVIIPDKVATFVFYGLTIPWGRLIEGIHLSFVMMILGSVVNYRYEILGNPLGYVKRDYIGEANDLELQQEIGMVVRQQHEGFLCYLLADCRTVAEQELALTKLQRNRVTGSKIAHLKDEVGDIISVPHPYTNATVKLMIAELSRRYKPASAQGNDGYLFDDIEAWVVT